MASDIVKGYIEKYIEKHFQKADPSPFASRKVLTSWWPTPLPNSKRNVTPRERLAVWWDVKVVLS
jgi:hypothetical protein